MNQTQGKTSTLIQAAGGLLWRMSPNGYEIAIIHRPRYDDWSLPKGKLQNGETWLQAALREVREETGYSARAVSFAGAVSYETTKGPKVVCFWHMLPEGEAGNYMKDEVEEVLWLPIAAARDKLQYPLEKALLDIWKAPGELTHE